MNTYTVTLPDGTTYVVQAFSLYASSVGIELCGVTALDKEIVAFFPNVVSVVRNI